MSTAAPSMVLGNSSTHKTPAIRDWLITHPRFTFHFIPTSSSWMNLVERWFAELRAGGREADEERLFCGYWCTLSSKAAATGS